MPDAPDPLAHYDNIGKRLLQLQAKLKARRGNPAFADNVPALEAEIARLENVQAHHKDHDL